MKLSAKREKALLDTVSNMTAPFIPVSSDIGFPASLAKSITLMTAMRVMGMHSLIASGSAKWLVMSEEEQGDAMLSNKEVIPYFGYNLDFDEAVPLLVMAKVPDDIHVWVEDTDGNIYDASTTEVMQEFEHSLGMPWPENRKLPPLIHGSPDELANHGWYYTRHDMASTLMGNCAAKLTMLTAMSNSPL